MRYTKYILHMAGITGKQYGLPGLSPNNPMSGAVVLGIEELFSNLLGIQQLSVAMRRNPDEIGAFIDRWDAERITPVIKKIRAGKGPNYKYCFDSSILMLAHNVMNKKQFERFYWPHMKELLDAVDSPAAANAAMEACQKGMDTVGRLFEEGEYFVGDLIYAGELMSDAAEVLKPYLAGTETSGAKTKMILCTVKDDLHDIGKNIGADEWAHSPRKTVDTCKAWAK